MKCAACKYDDVKLEFTKKFLGNFKKIEICLKDCEMDIYVDDFKKSLYACPRCDTIKVEV